MSSLTRWFERLTFPMTRAINGFERGVCARLQTVSSPLLPDILRAYGASIGEDTDIVSPLVVHNSKGSFRHLTIGAGCYVGPGCLLDLKDRITIGKNSTIAMRVLLLTHIDVGRSAVRFQGYETQHAPLTIGADVYIGAGATLLHGVSVGDGAVIGAGALVRDDVPPGTLVAGVPARVIRSHPPVRAAPG